MGLFRFFRRKNRNINRQQSNQNLVPQQAFNPLEQNQLRAQTMLPVPDALFDDFSENAASETVSQPKGTFGLKPVDPIPLKGLPFNSLYLNNLLLKNGKPIRWNRAGCISSGNIEKPVDKYNIFDMQGNFICSLYLCSYHIETSSKAPEGFKFKSKPK